MDPGMSRMVATTVAFVFKEGIIVAADSMPNVMETKSNFPHPHSIDNIIEINSHILATNTMIGGAAQCQNWHKILGDECRLYELLNKRSITVTGASKRLVSTLQLYKGMRLCVGTIIAGWDATGPGLYHIDSQGRRLRGTRFSVGSGSRLVYGVLSDGYHYHMSIKEAADLARRSISKATVSDSPDIISVYYVGPNGWKKLSSDDVGELHCNPIFPSVEETADVIMQRNVDELRYMYYPVFSSTFLQGMAGAVSPSTDEQQLKCTVQGCPRTFRCRRAFEVHVAFHKSQKLSGDDVGELHHMYNPVVPSTVEQDMPEAVVPSTVEQEIAGAVVPSTVEQEMPQAVVRSTVEQEIVGAVVPSTVEQEIAGAVAQCTVQQDAADVSLQWRCHAQDCSKKFSSSVALQFHVADHHKSQKQSGDDLGMVACNICSVHIDRSRVFDHYSVCRKMSGRLAFP